MNKFLFQLIGGILIALGSLLPRTATSPWVVRQPSAKVLILNSYHPGLVWSDREIEGVRATLPDDAEIFIEYMDGKRISGEPAYLDLLYQTYQHKYGNTHFDAIIALDDDAFRFLLQHHQALFPNTPVVFCGVSGYQPNNLAERPLFTGVVEKISHAETLALIRRLHPDVQRIGLITDQTTTGQIERARLEALVATLDDGIVYEFLDSGDGLTVDELLQKVQAAPPGSVLYYSDFFQDSAGEVTHHQNLIPLLSQRSPVPIYAHAEMYLMEGIVGGNMNAGQFDGQAAGEIAMRILAGEQPWQIPVQSGPSRNMFDYQQLLRWKIPLDRLPADSIIVNRQQTFFEQYGHYVIGGITFFVMQSLIIALLLFNILRRHRMQKLIETQAAQLQSQNEALRQAQEEVRRWNSQLEQRVNERTAQLEAVNRELEAFSYSVSHDLRAPLRHLSGYTQILLDDYAPQTESGMTQVIQRIQNAGQQMNQLIESLLELSRLTRGKFHCAPVNLSKLADEIARELQEEAPDRPVQWTIAPGLIAQADERLAAVLLKNLLENAWKYSAQTPHAQIEFGSTPLPDGNVAYFVRDNGVGFDMAYAGKLFTAFQRLHSAEEYPGHGVGLATAQRIVHRHGGRIWAESAVGKGATFTFTLPNPIVT
jgi:signal transduction histidine kinase